MQNSSNMIVQIYEIQRPEEAEVMIRLGVDHLGSVIADAADIKVPKIREVVEMAAAAGKKSSLIPLFSDAADIFRVIDYYRPRFIHFCEDLLTPAGMSAAVDGLIAMQAEVRARYSDVGIIRSIPIVQAGSGQTLPSLALAERFAPVSDFFLTDTWLPPAGGAGSDQPEPGFVGITGKTCDWDVAAALVRASAIPVILAGGLTPENVAGGIEKVGPAGVDSCTGTNALDGKGRPIRFVKDMEKVRAFVERARG